VPPARPGHTETWSRGAFVDALVSVCAEPLAPAQRPCGDSPSVPKTATGRAGEGHHQVTPRTRTKTSGTSGLLDATTARPARAR